MRIWNLIIVAKDIERCALDIFWTFSSKTSQILKEGTLETIKNFREGDPSVSFRFVCYAKKKKRMKGGPHALT